MHEAPLQVVMQTSLVAPQGGLLVGVDDQPKLASLVDACLQRRVEAPQMSSGGVVAPQIQPDTSGSVWAISFTRRQVRA